MHRNVRRGNAGRFIGYAVAAVLGSAAFAAAADIGTRVAYSGALGDGPAPATDRLPRPLEQTRPVRVVLASPYGN